MIITIFFYAEAKETVVSPTDVVFSNSNSFNSWWKIANCSTGGGELKLYKLNSITTCSILLDVNNRIWYLKQEITSIVYRAKIGISSDAFFHTVTRSTQHNLCHHHLFHAGNCATDNIDDVVDGISSLHKRNPFFSCGDCSIGK